MDAIQVFHGLYEAQNTGLYQAKANNPADLIRLAGQYLGEAEAAHIAAAAAARKCYPSLVPSLAAKMERHRRRLSNIGQELVDARDADIRKIFDDAVSAASASQRKKESGEALPKPSEPAEVVPPAVSIEVEGNMIVVEGDRHTVEPHLAKWVEMLLEGRLEGKKVSGKELLALPGANGKKIGREFEKLLAQVPKLKGIITSQSGKGGGWYLKC